MVDFLDEVIEDVKKEKFKQLFDKYGNYVVGFILAVVVFTGVSVAVKTYIYEKKIDSGDIFYGISSDIDKTDQQVKDGLDQVIKDGSQGYVVLALFNKARILVSEEKFDEAIKIYQEAAQVTSSPVLGDYAELQRINILLKSKETLGTKDGKLLKGTLERLTEGDRPLRFTAREMLGLWEFRNERKDRAKEIFKSLSKDALSPRSIRERATIILSSLED